MEREYQVDEPDEDDGPHSQAETGFQRGIDRARDQFRLEVDFDALLSTRSKLADIVGSWPYQVSDSFVLLVSEVIGVASAARNANEFADLSRDQIVGYLAHSADILDSLKHA